MPQFYPNVGKPRPQVTRATSLSGKPYKGGHNPKLDPLEEWEGARTFRDARSPTGWISRKGHVIGGVTVNGVPLLLTKTGKLMFNPPDDEGNLLSKALKVWVPAAAALDFQGDVIEAGFGQDVAELTSGLAGTAASTLLPGSGNIVGLAQGLLGLVENAESPELADPLPRAPGLVQDLAQDIDRPGVPALVVIAGIVLIALAVSR